MNIIETISRKGVWEVNAKESFYYFANVLGQDGLEESEADRIYPKLADVRFSFHNGIFLHYGETPFGQMKFLTDYFRLEEEDSYRIIRTYKTPDFESEPTLQMVIQSITAEKLIFYLIEDDIYFVCDYTEDKKKFPKE